MRRDEKIRTEHYTTRPVGRGRQRKAKFYTHISIHKPTTRSLRQLLETVSGHHIVEPEEAVEVLTVVWERVPVQRLTEFMAEL